MRIAISTIMDVSKSGSWQAVKNIILELKKNNINNQYVIFVEKPYRDDLGLMPDNFKIVRVPINTKQPILNILWHGFVLPFLIIRYKVDVLYLPLQSLAFLIKTKPTIITVHDLIEYHLKRHYSKSRMLYRKFMLPISARIADKIVAVSEYTKNDIIKYLNIQKNKIEVIYNAPALQYGLLDKTNCREYLKNKYGIDGSFILYVGRIQHPNKNLVHLLYAFKKIQSYLNIHHKLIFVGSQDSGADIVYKMVNKLALSNDVIFTGYVPDEDLPYFYNTADVFVYPSLFEGFGMPIVEAMSCGCPVVTSNTTALQEISGNAAILIDPKNINDIAESILKVLGDNVKRQEMIQKGLQNARKYSWEKSAKIILDTFNTVKTQT